MGKNAKLFSVTNGERWGWDVTLGSATLYPDYFFVFFSFRSFWMSEMRIGKVYGCLWFIEHLDVNMCSFVFRCEEFNKATATQSGIIFVVFMIWMLIWDFSGILCSDLIVVMPLYWSCNLVLILSYRHAKMHILDHSENFQNYWDSEIFCQHFANRKTANYTLLTSQKPKSTLYVQTK